MTEKKTIGYFLNTRPTDRAQPLTYVLEQAGWHVDVLPLLELIPLPVTKQDQNAFRQLVVQPPRVIVAVSPTAARLGLQALDELKINAAALPIRWLAVGHGTAQVLKAVGITADVPELETSEGLIASSALSDLVVDELVMVWRGIGGRELVQENLLARGVRLQVLNLYQRQLPPTSKALWANYCATTSHSVKKDDKHLPDVVLLSSGESWRYWRELAGEQALIPWLLVLGQRLMDEVVQLTPRIRRLTSLQPQHILEVVAEIEDFR
ncbi:MAG: uroporphyrinogen-III synthase [Aquirhabdus sp.]